MGRKRKQTRKTLKKNDKKMEFQVAAKSKGRPQYKRQKLIAGREDDLEGGNQQQQLNPNVWLRIFSEEVWLYLLDYITDSKDFQSVCHASPYLRNILLPRRTKYLFPAVWNILGLHYHKKHPNDPSYNQRADDSHSASKHLRRNSRITSGKHFTKWWYSGILNLRLVCKNWSSAIETFYQNPETYEDPNVEQSSSWVQTQFDGVTGKYTLIKFMAHFKKTHLQTNDDGVLSSERNPFLGRKLTLHYHYDNTQSSERMWSTITAMLELYGHHVWNCSLQVSSGDSNRRKECFQKVRKLLEFMPELKTLHVARLNSDQSPGSPAENLESELSFLGEMPTLKNLQVLTTKDLLAPTFNSLVQANPHISTLEASGELAYDIGHVKLPNLRQLSINLHSHLHFNSLYRGDNHWSLSKLKVEFEPGYFVEWPQVFLWIQDKGATTLTDLEITSAKSESMVEKKIIMKWSAKGKLNLNQLKRLKLKMSNLSTLDFLLPLKETLEELTVQIEYDMASEMNKRSNAPGVAKNQKVQFVGYNTREKMLGSNIWELFPSLKRFEFAEFYVVDSCRTCGNKWVISREESGQSQQLLSA